MAEHSSSEVIQRMLVAQRSKVRWCVHILGLDEVHAMPSYEAAEKNAADLVAALYNARTESLGVLCLPIVAPWPWSSDSHAQALQAALSEGTDAPASSPHKSDPR